jgi:hypothetical protein
VSETFTPCSAGRELSNEHGLVSQKFSEHHEIIGYIFITLVKTGVVGPQNSKKKQDFSKNVFILLDRALHGHSKTGGGTGSLSLLFAEKFQNIFTPRI